MWWLFIGPVATAAYLTAMQDEQTFYVGALADAWKKSRGQQ